MKHMVRILFIILSGLSVLCLAYAAPVGAQSPDRRDTSSPAFFTALNDVPLMRGLTELPDETVVFDKPEGRIVESSAYAAQDGPSATDIEAFYNKTLPHLGWRQVARGKYLREDEVLQVEIEAQNGTRHMVVSVMPHD